jgi:REP element-mobilizing transposase RayT
VGDDKPCGGTGADPHDCSSPRSARDRLPDHTACSERRFFLRPSRTINDIFLYVLALAASRHGVLVHAFCVLSNHAHLVVTDPRGRLPAFMQYLDSLVAGSVNASLGRFEAFWATDGSYSAVEPLDADDVLAKTAYVLANPVAAGLVRRGPEWPLDCPRTDRDHHAHGAGRSSSSIPRFTSQRRSSPS